MDKVYKQAEARYIIKSPKQVRISLNDVLMIEASACFVHVLEKGKFVVYFLPQIDILELINSEPFNDMFCPIYLSSQDVIFVRKIDEGKLKFEPEIKAAIIDGNYAIELMGKGSYERLSNIYKAYEKICQVMREFSKQENKKYSKQELSKREKTILNFLCAPSNIGEEALAEFLLAIGVLPYTILVRLNIYNMDSMMSMLSSKGAIDTERYEIIDCVVFPLNFKTVEEYIKLQNSPAQPKNTYQIKNTKIIYDLEKPVSSIQVLDEFLDALCDYINLTKNQRVKKLFEGNIKEVKVSKILQAVDGGKHWYYSDGDLDFFHSTVTKCMVSSGWLTDYPALWFDVKNTYMLRLDTIKYILANWNWIAWSYDSIVLTNFIKEYGALSLKDSAIEEDVLRRALITKCLDTIDSWNKYDTRLNEFITSTKRNVFFKKNKYNQNMTTANSTFIGSLEPGGWAKL